MPAALAQVLPGCNRRGARQTALHMTSDAGAGGTAPDFAGLGLAQAAAGAARLVRTALTTPRTAVPLVRPKGRRPVGARHAAAPDIRRLRGGPGATGHCHNGGADGPRRGLCQIRQGVMVWPIAPNGGASSPTGEAHARVAGW
jgi:hypothetical protein